MGLLNLILFLVIGAVAGWLAGQLLKGGGFGLIGDIIVGVIGAVLGGWLFDVLKIVKGHSLLGQLVTALVGAIVFLLILRLIKRA